MAICEEADEGRRKQQNRFMPHRVLPIVRVGAVHVATQRYISAEIRMLNAMRCYALVHKASGPQSFAKLPEFPSPLTNLFSPSKISITSTSVAFMYSIFLVSPELLASEAARYASFRAFFKHSYRKLKAAR